MADIKFNVMGIVGLIGALLMIVGVFLNWYEVTVPKTLISEAQTYGITGMDLFGGEVTILGQTLDASVITDYSYAPIVALICGVISLIAMVFPMIMPGKNIGKLLGIVGLVLAVVAIVITFLCYGDLNEYAFTFGNAEGSVAIGLWLVVVGAIITILGGILDIVKKAD